MMFFKLVPTLVASLLLVDTSMGAAHAVDFRVTQLTLESDNFKNLDKLVPLLDREVHQPNGQLVLTSLWREFERRNGGSTKALAIWFDFLQGQVNRQSNGRIGYARQLPHQIHYGRVGTCFEVVLNGRSLCLKLPSSFEGNVWSEMCQEYTRAIGFMADHKLFPCDSLTQYAYVDQDYKYQLQALVGPDLDHATLSSEQAMPMMFDLLRALNTLHVSMGRPHNDIKLANICAPLCSRAQGGRFTLVDALTATSGELTSANISTDLELVRDMPSMCFKRHFTHVVDTLAAHAFNDNSIHHLFWRGRGNRARRRRIPMAILPDIVEEISEQHDFEGELQDARALLGYMEEINAISDDIHRRIELANLAGGDVNACASISGEVLEEYFEDYMQ